MHVDNLTYVASWLVANYSQLYTVLQKMWVMCSTHMHFIALIEKGTVILGNLNFMSYQVAKDNHQE